MYTLYSVSDCSLHPSPGSYEALLGQLHGEPASDALQLRGLGGREGHEGVP